MKHSRRNRLAPTLVTVVAVAAAASYGCDRASDESSTAPKPPETAPPSPSEISAIVLPEDSDDYHPVPAGEAARLLGGSETDGAKDTGAEVPTVPFASIPHPGYRGPLGPYDDAAVLFADDGEDDPDSLFLSLVRWTDGGRELRRIGALAGPWRVDRIDDVFFADAGNDGDVDLFVTGRFRTDLDPTRSRRFGATIPYVWRDGHFRYPNRLDDPLGDAPDLRRAVDILRRNGIVENSNP